MLDKECEFLQTVIRLAGVKPQEAVPSTGGVNCRICEYRDILGPSYHERRGNLRPLRIFLEELQSQLCRSWCRRSAEFPRPQMSVGINESHRNLLYQRVGATETQPGKAGPAARKDDLAVRVPVKAKQPSSVLA